MFRDGVVITPEAVAIPLLDLRQQHHELAEGIGAAFKRVLESGRFIKGPETAAFEEEFAKAVGANAAVGVANGTDALSLTLRALGIGEGDEVIVPSMTFVATAEAVITVGARVVFADVDQQSLNLTPETIEPVLSSRTSAIIPVHLYGNPASPDRICALANTVGCRVVFDAAQAHGALWQAQSVAMFGDASCYSFYPGKNLGALGDAGAVVSDNTELIARVRLLADHGRRDKYEHLVPGQNSRLDALQAAFLRVKLPFLPGWVAARRAAALRYHTLLRDVPMIQLLAPDDAAASAYHLFVVRTPRRDAALTALRAAGIEAGVHYPIPLHQQPAFRPPVRSLPVSEGAARTVLSLPLFPGITAAQQERVAEALAAVA